MADEPVDKTPKDEETAEEAPEAATAEQTPEADTAEQVAQESPAARIISPDVGFVRQIIAAGGDSLKKCYQCAQCSVVCNITPDENPFPRKEMMWAQWGLKDKLIGSADIWLCHQCADCTANCPRGAEPGQVMQAVGKLSLGHYSWPSFMGNLLGSAKSLLLLATIPVAIIFLLILGFGNLTNIPRGLEDGGLAGEIVYSRFLSLHAIDVAYSMAFFFAIFVLLGGSMRYWHDMKRSAISNGLKMNGGFVSNIVPTITEILDHRRFRKCDTTRNRASAHIFVFYSFIGLFLTTTWSAFYTNFLGKHSPWSLGDPLKIVGNSSAVAFLIGMTLVLIYRFRNAEKAGTGTYYDWLFIVLIYTVGLSGIFTELLRVAGIGVIAYPMYFVHLASIMFLFIYAPYSKMAHMFYRGVAMVFAKATGRDPAS